MGHKGLLPFINYTIHVVHNAFHKGIVALRQDVEVLACDLHAWFKRSPCKEEDFRELSDSTTIEDGSLFLRHVDTRWPTLCLVLERIVERWDDVKEYFLKYLPEKKEYTKSLPKNSRCQRIVKALKEEVTTLAGIEFLIGVAPLFSTYLLMGPLVHCLLEEMTTLIYQLVGRFIKEDEINECKTNKDLLTLNVSDAGTQMKLENIHYGTKTKKLLKKLLEGKRKETMAAMRDSYVNMETDLQKSLPLDASLLMHLKCPDPANCKKAISIVRIGKVGQLLSHVITEREVTSVQDQFKLLQVEQVPDSWFKEKEGKLKRIDIYWAKVVNI